MEQERRRSPRYTLHQLVQLGFGREDFVAAEGINISEEGIGCRTKEPVDHYARMYIMIQLDPNNEESIIRCEGVVSRSNKIKEGEYDVGIEFTDIFDFDRKKIAKELTQ